MARGVPPASLEQQGLEVGRRRGKRGEQRGPVDLVIWCEVGGAGQRR